MDGKPLEDAQALDVIHSAMRQIGVLKAGRGAKPDDIDICQLHLSSIHAENDGHFPFGFTALAAELAQRISPEFRVFPSFSPEWYGDKIETMPPAGALIQSVERPVTAEVQDAMEFYGGKQWHREVLAHRGARPSIVINLLPSLVAAAIEAHRKAGYPDLSEAQMEHLITTITTRNRDAQRMYNYMASAKLEREAAAREGKA